MRHTLPVVAALSLVSGIAYATITVSPFQSRNQRRQDRIVVIDVT